ncbi:hypothetical protein Dimus_009535 [Dionaea muscipula]
MDAKAMAKSKRSHTKQHQPKKPHHRPKTLSTPNSSSSSSTSSTDPKMVKVEAREKKRPTQSSLPSNWDRYDEVPDEREGGGGGGLFGSDSEDPSLSRPSSSKTETDVVKPRSKGADYGYLVSEAKSRLLLPNRSPNFDDSLPDAFQGLAPLLAVRGENIVSWMGVNNFLDDETAPFPEVPFFSLNLHTLAEQLLKAPLAKRLFIKDDLFPPELWVEETKESNHVQTPTAAAAECSSQPTLPDSTENRSESAGPSSSVPTVVSVSSSKGDDDIFKATDSLGFKAAAAEAEAELDMLLDSFNEAKLSDPFTAAVHHNTSMKGKSSVNVASSDRGGFSSSSAASPSIDLDDISIDDLLSETTNAATTTHEDAILQSSEVRLSSAGGGDPSVSSSHPPGPNPKSKVLEDFDSWFDTI